MFDDFVFLPLLVIGLALVFSGPAALVAVLVQRQRIAELERSLAKLARGGVAPSPAPEQPQSRPAAWSPLPAPAPAPPPVSQPVSQPARPQQPPPSKPRPSFEERFGTRWVVWVGGIALAFGAALLVRYSVESGFFGPGLRVAAALALSFGILAAGEALRRRLRGGDGVPSRWPDIPATVTAAGTLGLFGTVYAAHALYGFIGPALAFGALAATGLLAMFAALLHGPALAGLGLVGALAAPLLVGGSSRDLWPLALYLPVVAATAYAFAWSRGWRGLAIAAGLGGGAWSVLLAAMASGTPPTSASAAALVHAVLQTTLATVLFAILPHRSDSETSARLAPLATVALAAAGLVFLFVLAVLSGRETDPVWMAAAVTAVALPAIAGLLAPAAALGLSIAGVVLCAVIALWPPELGLDRTTLPIWPETSDPGWLLALAGPAAIAVAAAGALRLMGGSRLPVATALAYAAGATLTPLAALSVAYLRVAEGAVSPSFAAAAGALAAGLTAIAAAFRRESERAPSDALKLGTGAFASGAVASLSLGLVFALSGGSLTVAMALSALGTAAIARRLDLAPLRWCVAGLGAVVAARLAYDPTVVGPDLGRMPVFNWLLVGYGLPALAFAAASRLIRLPGRTPDAPVMIAQALAVLLAAFLVFFEIRHALHDGDILASGTGLVEQGLMALSALGFAVVLVRLDGVHGSPVIRFASLAFGALAFVQSLIGLVLAENPLLTDAAVAGGPVFNEIALSYGMPALAAFALARTAAASRPVWYVRAAAGLAVVLGFVGLSLMIRHGFQGERLGIDRFTSEGEWYAYSAGWLALGLLFLAYGILRGSLTARIVSAALVGLTTVKVFLFDLSGLDGPLRALSFLGLGAVLIGIGLIYQRFLFAPAEGGRT